MPKGKKTSASDVFPRANKKWAKWDLLQTAIRPLKRQYARKAVKLVGCMLDLEDPANWIAFLQCLGDLGLEVAFEAIQYRCKKTEEKKRAV